MVKVTDKNYYMDGYLQNNLDFLIKREKKKWDNLIIMDGDPGVGKSSFAFQIGYYLAYTQNKSFSTKNIFFEVDALNEYAIRERNKIIVWDESALEGMGMNWQNKNQQKLLKILYTARKFGHMFIFIIPEIHKLQQVFAGKRSIALIRVYSPNNLDRGYFRVYNKSQKIQVYQQERSSNFNHKILPSFYGRFTSPKNCEDIIDMKIYEAMKDKAIENITKEEEDSNPDRIKLVKLLSYLTQNKVMNQTKIAQTLGITQPQVSRLLAGVT